MKKVICLLLLSVFVINASAQNTIVRRNNKASSTKKIDKYKTFNNQASATKEIFRFHTWTGDRLGTSIWNIVG